MNQDMKALVPFSAALGPYLLLLAKGIKFSVLDLVERSTHGTCKLATEKLFALPLALPPLLEQERIVGRAQEMLALLAGLKAGCASADATQQTLASASLHHASA